METKSFKKRIAEKPIFSLVFAFGVGHGRRNSDYIMMKQVDLLINISFVFIGRSVLRSRFA